MGITAAAIDLGNPIKPLAGARIPFLFPDTDAEFVVANGDSTSLGLLTIANNAIPAPSTLIVNNAAGSGTLTLKFTGFARLSDAGAIEVTEEVTVVGATLGTTANAYYHVTSIEVIAAASSGAALDVGQVPNQASPRARYPLPWVPKSATPGIAGSSVLAVVETNHLYDQATNTFQGPQSASSANQWGVIMLAPGSFNKP